MIKKPLLASPAELDLIRYPVLATPKLDGIRAVKVDGKMLSRSFKLIPNVYAQELFSSILFDGMDGEIMLKDPKATFQEITSAVMSEAKSADFVFHAFDWVNSDLKEPYHQRVRRLCQTFEDNPHDRIQVLKPTLIKTRDDLDVYETKCLEKGFEGIMIRDPHGPYKCGRSTVKEGILLKVKRFEDSEAKIVALFERMKNTNEQERDELGHAKRSTKKDGMVPTGMLGGFEVEDLKTGVRFSIGSGLDDTTRQKIWSEKDSYIGKIVKYKYQPIGVDASTGVPRFPIYLGIRHPNDM